MRGEPNLMPNEHLVLLAHPHWWYFWKHVAAGLGVVLLFALSLWVGGWVGTVLRWLTAVGALGEVGALVYALFNWRTTIFAVTDRQVSYEAGLFRRRGVSIPLSRVNNVNFTQSLIARMLGNGIVTIESAGETGNSVFENIPDPERVRRTIFEQMDALEAAQTDRGADAIVQAMSQDATPPGSTQSLEQRLRELDSLRSSGLLSEDEYAERRSRILDNL